jgi:5-methyltetrahydrofolate--homocysteine methyltransferase
VRKTLWGYAPDEALTNEELVRQNAGMTLTESFAMIPTSAASGYYFAHPDAEYFGVARIGRDQLEDYAKRRGIPLEQAEKYLRPSIGY